MVLLLFIFLIVALLTGKKVYGIYINPISIFIGLFLLGFILLQISDFISISVLSAKMTWIYIVSFICYALGIIFSRAVGTRSYSQNKQDLSKCENRAYYQQEIKVIFSIVLVSTLIYWMACIRLYGTEGLFSNLLSSKETDNLSGLSNIVLYLKMLSIFLSPYVLYYIIIFKDKSPFYLIVLIFTFVANIAYTRNTIFYIAILDLMIYAYTRENKNKSVSLKWVLYAGIVFLLFRFFSYTQVLFNKQFSVEGTVLGRSVDAALLTIISYFAGPLVSASIYTAQMNNIPRLGYTLRNLMSLANMFGAGIDTSSYMPDYWVFIPFKFNTASIQFYIFGEGGWIWTIVFFILIGFIFDKSFCNYRNNGGKAQIMLLSFLSLLMILSIRGYLLGRLDMFIYLVTLLVIWFLNSGKVKRIVFTFKLRKR